MVTLAVARTANAAFSPSYVPTAIFVGGTSGIGRATAEGFARYTKGNAHIVLVGRNKSAAEEIIASFPKPTESQAKHEFVSCDVFLMRNIRNTTTEFCERLPKINFLVLSPGIFHFGGRDETEEGIDKRLQLHYYARWKFVNDLLPLLRKAKDAGEDSKVLSVLSAGKGGAIDLDNLGLKNGYRFTKAGRTSPTYTDLMFEHHAEEHPDIAFIHCNPGLVNTPLFQSSRWVSWLWNMLKPLASTPEDCAEYTLYSLFQSDKGLCRRNSEGDDIERNNYHGSDEARVRVWEHSKEEVERALCLDNDTST